MILKSKILNALLILTSLIGYLEWGGNNKAFLFQAELEVFHRFLLQPNSVHHLLIILPILGQLFLLVTLFQKKPRKMLTGIGVGFIGILLMIIFLIGLTTLNLKVMMSALPFLVVAGFTIAHYRKVKPIYKED